MNLIWNLPDHTFSVGGRLYKLGGGEPVSVPDSVAAQIFSTRMWKDAEAKGKATSVSDEKLAAQTPQPLESKAERRAKKAVANAASAPAPALVIAPSEESDAE